MQGEDVAEPFADLTNVLFEAVGPQAPGVIQQAGDTLPEHATAYEKFKVAAINFDGTLHPDAAQRPTEQELGTIIATSTKVALAAGHPNPVADPALLALFHNINQHLAAVHGEQANVLQAIAENHQQGQAAMQAVQQSLGQQQQTLAAIQQELRVLRAQQFNSSARRRNSARLDPQHDLQLVPLQRELPPADGGIDLLGQAPAIFPDTLKAALQLTGNQLNQLQIHYGEPFGGANLGSRRKAFLAFIG